jgi:hypothetical protein
MPDETGPKGEHPNPHLHDPETGLRHGVPAGVAQEESKGLPNSDRQSTESAPIHKGGDA